MPSSIHTKKDIQSLEGGPSQKQQKTHSVSFLEKELGKVGTVLSGDTGDEGDLAVIVGGDFSRHVGLNEMVEMTSIESFDDWSVERKVSN